MTSAEACGGKKINGGYRGRRLLGQMKPFGEIHGYLQGIHNKMFPSAWEELVKVYAIWRVGQQRGAALSEEEMMVTLPYGGTAAEIGPHNTNMVCCYRGQMCKSNIDKKCQESNWPAK